MLSFKQQSHSAIITGGGGLGGLFPVGLLLWTGQLSSGLIGKAGQKPAEQPFPSQYCQHLTPVQRALSNAAQIA